MDMKDYELCTAQGWSEAAVTDAVWVTGMFCMMTRVAEGHGLEATEGNMRQVRQRWENAQKDRAYLNKVIRKEAWRQSLPSCPSPSTLCTFLAGIAAGSALTWHILHRV
eukprot:TRINITY_DN70578_c0_g1_i1.p5 TRINITY_DN70578_c0_g1~~TRINITY_DN70578_c0_g1_i1.p5  ORF type:complete len:109 (+),score=34.75 TRINITY_DN70578_c0_g1_i1:496-822(+)